MTPTYFFGWSLGQRMLLLLLLVAGVTTAALFVEQTDLLAFAFSADFLVTLPLGYLLLLRNTKVPASSVVPFSLAMLLLASYVLPEERQAYLSLYKMWILPLLELLVLGLVVLKMRQAKKAYAASGKETDVYYRLQQAVQAIVGKGRAAAVITTECAMLYYAFSAFRRSGRQQGFSYHKKNGVVALIIAGMLLVVIETGAVHALVMQWSPGLAYVLTLLSLYSLLYLLAFIGATIHRPHQFTDEGLLLRFGLQETLIPYRHIQYLDRLRADVPDDERIAKLGIMGNYNMKLQTDQPLTLKSLYGFCSRYTQLVFWVDDRACFQQELDRRRREP